MFKCGKQISYSLAKRIHFAAKRRAVRLPETQYVWIVPGEPPSPCLVQRIDLDEDLLCFDVYDVSELTALLPNHTVSKKCRDRHSLPYGYLVEVSDWRLGFREKFSGETYANALGEMMLWRIEAMDEIERSIREYPQRQAGLLDELRAQSAPPGNSG